MPSWELSKYNDAKLQATCFYLIPLLLHTKPFFKKKTKKDLELFSLSHFLHNFWRKIFLLLCSINWPSIIGCFWWDIWQYVHYNCLLSRLWRREFWNKPFLSSQAAFLWPKSHDKNLNKLRTKRAFTMK